MNTVDVSSRDISEMLDHLAKDMLTVRSELYNLETAAGYRGPPKRLHLLSASEWLEWRDTSGTKHLQFWRRTYFLAVFAFVEAEIWVFKDTALLVANDNKELFTIGELSLLQDRQFDLQKGRVRAQPKYLKLHENWRFAVQAFAKALGSSYMLNIEDEKWKWFLEAIAVRNRITHPKKEIDLFISDDEADRLMEVSDWMEDVYSDIIGPVVVKLNRRHES